MARGGECAGEIGGSDEAVGLHKQRRSNVRRELRLGFPRRLCIEDLALDSRITRVGDNLLERVERLIGGDHLQRAGATIANADAGIARKAIDKPVVHVETSRRERQNRAAKTLEIRHEHAGGRLRRAETCPTAVDERHRCASRHQLIGDGCANHSCADDRNVTIWHNLLIISRSPAAPLEGQSGSEGDIWGAANGRKHPFFTIFARSMWVRALLLE